MGENTERSPTVSVVTTCFNAHRTIERTLRSVLEQTHPCVDYWVMDAASQDSTLEVVERFRPLFDGRMQYESAPDRGTYDGFNKGIRRCTGSIIGILNSDDWYEPDAIEKVVEAFRRHPDGGVFYGIARIVAMDGRRELWVSRRHHNLLSEGMISHPAMFVTRDAYLKHGLYSLDYPIAADYEFAVRLRRLGVRFVPIDHILAAVRVGGISDQRQLKADLECAAIRYRSRFVSRIRYWVFVTRAWSDHLRRSLKGAIQRLVGMLVRHG
jgi:glycosyltransferase involved in cell wall biosynthesis